MARPLMMPSLRISKAKLHYLSTLNDCIIEGRILVLCAMEKWDIVLTKCILSLNSCAYPQHLPNGRADLGGGGLKVLIT